MIYIKVPGMYWAEILVVYPETAPLEIQNQKE